jgi:hypothetical protein
MSQKWIAKCRGCGETKEQDDKRIREWYCTQCQEWVPFVEVKDEATSPNTTT